MDLSRGHLLAAAAGAILAAGVAVPVVGGGAASLSVPATVPVIHTPGGAEAPTPVSCGRERWNVKTLTDPGSGDVNPSAQPTTVDALTASQPPAQALGPDASRQPAEDATYTVHATLVLAKVESDSDFHLVLADPTDGKALIAEIPDPACATGSRVLEQITQTRSDYIRMFGTPDGSQIDQPVTITGVFFYDRDHGQTGRAFVGGNSDVELHPALSIAAG